MGMDAEDDARMARLELELLVLCDDGEAPPPASGTATPLHDDDTASSISTATLTEEDLLCARLDALEAAFDTMSATLAAAGLTGAVHGSRAVPPLQPLRASSSVKHRGRRSAQRPRKSGGATEAAVLRWRPR
mmetsp:Transcript_17037/g.68679  ORF Transcript_17037/g.68679 Transcript_17037/m.68679 type:complete len:132 (-) Transcript_17037:128-523(-)